MKVTELTCIHYVTVFISLTNVLCIHLIKCKLCMNTKLDYSFINQLTNSILGDL